MGVKIKFVSGAAAHGSTSNGAAADHRQQERRSCGDGSGLRLCCVTFMSCAVAMVSSAVSSQVLTTIFVAQHRRGDSATLLHMQGIPVYWMLPEGG